MGGTGIREVPIPLYLRQAQRAIEDFLLIRRDSTYTNTGPEGGAIHYLKKLLDHKVHWLICLIHINELPLKTYDDKARW